VSWGEIFYVPLPALTSSASRRKSREYSSATLLGPTAGTDTSVLFSSPENEEDKSKDEDSRSAASSAFIKEMSSAAIVLECKDQGMFTTSFGTVTIPLSTLVPRLLQNFANGNGATEGNSGQNIGESNEVRLFSCLLNAASSGSGSEVRVVEGPVTHSSLSCPVIRIMAILVPLSSNTNLGGANGRESPRDSPGTPPLAKPSTPSSSFHAAYKPVYSKLRERMTEAMEAAQEAHERRVARGFCDAATGKSGLHGGEESGGSAGTTLSDFVLNPLKLTVKDLQVPYRIYTI